MSTLKLDPATPNLEKMQKLINRLEYLGVIPDEKGTRNFNVGNSDYSEKTIQPWSIWLDWNLDPWDADIIKRIARHKKGESRQMDYEKIIHICLEKIRQLPKDEIQNQAESISEE